MIWPLNKIFKKKTVQSTFYISVGAGVDVSCVDADTIVGYSFLVTADFELTKEVKDSIVGRKIEGIPMHVMERLRSGRPVSVTWEQIRGYIR
jgi:hypothetical protein